MDKASHYSLSIMQHFLSNYFVPQRTKQPTVWSDVGKHFRSKRTIPTLAYRVCGDFDYMAGTPLMEAMKLSSYFGMPRHFNNLCDKECAWQTGCNNQCTKRCTIRTVSDHIAGWQAYHDKALNNNPATQARLFIDYVPEPKPDILKWSVKVKALGAPITSCFAWTFNANDKRRRGEHMFDNICQKHTLTGLDCRANLLLGHVAVVARMFFIVTVPDNNLDAEEVKEAEEEELHAAPEALNGDIAVNVKLHEGWKMSYRLQRPEERTARDYLKPFANKQHDPLGE
jgi:hypothetical protein